MPIITILAIYFIVWWICLFLVLPFRVKNQIDTGEAIVAGTERGAPAGVFRFWPKLLATTVLAAVVTGLILWGVSNPLLREYWR
jgi:predicted secreted protein